MGPKAGGKKRGERSNKTNSENWLKMTGWPYVETRGKKQANQNKLLNIGTQKYKMQWSKLYERIDERWQMKSGLRCNK